ncbi:threonine-phosphate decarboxylase CobD [Hirschia litorea]|uniref:threonine-phosphate decarboxylase n=1 Tax=Hirschia litorea TaxID=1199156 RepID=A0ABW2IH48_9PROT
MSIDLVHGGSLDYMVQQFPSAPKPWLDLSTGINPRPYPIASIQVSALNHLPTTTAYDNCRKAMATAFLCPKETIMPAPGSEVLIRLLPTIIKPKKIAVLSPTYGDHLKVWRMEGLDVVESPDLLLENKNADCVVLCNPNNPDGQTFNYETLTALHTLMRERNGWLILDEAYIDLYPHLSFCSQAGADNLIILKSIGKFYGLAGLRLGALIAPPPILNAMAQRLGVWSISDFALDIGAKVYKDAAWKTQTRTHLQGASQRLRAILLQAGLTITGSTDLFSFVETQNAHSLWEQLAKLGIYTRRFSWSETHLRIGMPADEAGERHLKQALNL